MVFPKLITYGQMDADGSADQINLPMRTDGCKPSVDRIDAELGRMRAERGRMPNRARAGCGQSADQGGASANRSERQLQTDARAVASDSTLAQSHTICVLPFHTEDK